MKKLSLCILLFSSLFISSEDISMDEMVDFIVKGQFLSQQEDTMTNAMGTMLQTIGMDIKSKAMSDFLKPFIKEYLLKIEKKMPDLYKDVYSYDEITALYNFMKTKEGKSITNKQSLMVEKSMLLVGSDAQELSQNVVAALQENPEILQSLMK